MTSAQDEFNALIRDKDRDHRHPDDRHQDDDDDHSDRSRRDAADPDHYPEKQDTDDELDIPKEMRSNYYLPSIRSEANTGPKGVIADAHAFEKAKKQARRFTWRKSSPPNAYVSPFNDEKTSSDDENEEGFLQKWREARLRELQNAGQRIRSRTTSPTRRIYGTVTAVDGEGFLEAIEKTPRDTAVVVFIYDDMSQISSLVESYMRVVARRNETVRFIRLHYLEAEMEPAGVPAVLAYRNGEKFAGLVPIMDELPEDSELTEISLETLFRRNRILN